jgi:methyl-accepting chemotaxis protein
MLKRCIAKRSSFNSKCSDKTTAIYPVAKLALHAVVDPISSSPYCLKGSTMPATRNPAAGGLLCTKRQRRSLMLKSNRNLSNFLLTPKFQLKLTYYYIALGAGIILATLSGVFYKMTLIQQIMNDRVIAGMSSSNLVSEQVLQIALISMIGFVTFAMASFIFALMVSHRIAGPVVAITAYIDELKKGNLDYGRRLRPNDELTVIMDKLHALNAKLKQDESGDH